MRRTPVVHDDGLAMSNTHWATAPLRALARPWLGCVAEFFGDPSSKPLAVWVVVGSDELVNLGVGKGFFVEDLREITESLKATNLWHVDVRILVEVFESSFEIPRFCVLRQT